MLFPCPNLVFSLFVESLHPQVIRVLIIVIISKYIVLASIRCKRSTEDANNRNGKNRNQRTGLSLEPGEFRLSEVILPQL